MISDILIQSDFLYVLYHNSRTRAIALYRPASHGCSFVNGARKEYVCFAAAFFSSALIISHFVCPFLFFINLHPDFLSSIPIACTQKFSPENITFPKTKSVIFPILNFFYFPSTPPIPKYSPTIPFRIFRISAISVHAPVEGAISSPG